METTSPDPFASRRDFLRRAGIGAGALTVGSAVLPWRDVLAAAQEDSGGGEEPELGEDDLAAFAESVELAIVDAYETATASGRLPAAAAPLADAFAAHHREHATAIADVAGSKATGRANRKLAATVDDQIAAAPDGEAIVKVLFALENAIASNYLDILGRIEGGSAAGEMAAILAVEAQHAVALGSTIGTDLKALFPPGGANQGENRAFETTTRGVSMDRYPAVETTTTTEASS